jgi:hypothetical protein
MIHKIMVAYDESSEAGRPENCNREVGLLSGALACE